MEEKSNNFKKVTDQSFGTSDPASGEGARAGPRGSSSSDWSLNEKEVDPFKRRDKIPRAHSITGSKSTDADEFINSQEHMTFHRPARPSTTVDAPLVEQNQATIQESYVSDQGEVNYYNAWIDEKVAREKLETLVSQLQQQVAVLQQQISQKKEKNDQSDTKVQYWTDEEELAKETEWVLKENRRKRKKVSTPPKISPENNISREKKRVKVINEASKKPPIPPPIIVSHVKDYSVLYEALRKEGIMFKATMLNNEQVKFNVENSEAYRYLSKFLSNNYQWHSYEDKQTRPLRVMVRKLHPTCQPDNIVCELQSRNFKILEAVNILRRKDKTPLPLFMLTFQNGEDVKKVFEITEIQGMKVKIEAIRKSCIIPQCKRCQQYGQTQRFCNKERRCVKCAGKHETRDCQAKLSDNRAALKCVNCGENHPANYRGCEVAKKMQEIKNEALKSRKQKPAPKRVSNQNSYISKGRTYAQVIRIQDP